MASTKGQDIFIVKKIIELIDKRLKPRPEAMSKKTQLAKLAN